MDIVVFLCLESLKVWLALLHDLNYFLKHKQDIFFLFCIQNIKSNCYIIFVKFFPIIFFWWIVCSFSVMFIYKRFNFCYSLLVFFLFLHDLMQLLQCIESIDHLFYWWNLLSLFDFYPIRRIYIWCTAFNNYFTEFAV